MSWDAIKSAWDQGWKAVEAQGEAMVDAIVRAPRAYAKQVQIFVVAMSDSRESLDRQQTVLAQMPPGADVADLTATTQALEARYQELAAGFYSDTRPAQTAQPELAWVPVLIVGGLAVGVAGTAWAVSAYEYATNLREQTALAEKELAARVEASREGRLLQPSTLPVPPPAEGPSALGALLALGVVGGGAFAFYKLRS